jgi:DNA-binding transcriptional MocR family regulator
LPPGAQLPPQRDLAYQLKIGVGTVTKVYAEARRRGLLTATVGRGSFVAGQTQAAANDAGLIDFSRNLAPQTAAAARLGDALAALRRRTDLAEHLTYAPPAGMTAHRQAGAKWLAQSANFSTDWQRLIVCEGGQHALALAFASLCKPGDAVLTEAATFFGVRTIAEQLGINLLGVKMDREGLLPDALDRAATKSGARILYTIPTLQNPTGRMMGARRREEIAAVAKKRNLTVVEDDVYAAFAGGREVPTIAELIPERAFYVATLSKMIAPGLRCGYLLTPDEDRFERVIKTVRAFSYAPSAFGPLIGTQWIEEGTAPAIAAAVKRDVAQRTKLAVDILGKAIEGPHSAVAPHVWLPMSELKAERVAGAALRGRVVVTPPAAPIVDGKEISGLRLCIGAPADMAALERGLKIVASALGDGPESIRSVV